MITAVPRYVFSVRSSVFGVQQSDGEEKKSTRCGHLFGGLDQIPKAPESSLSAGAGDLKANPSPLAGLSDDAVVGEKFLVRNGTWVHWCIPRTICNLRERSLGQ